MPAITTSRTAFVKCERCSARSKVVFVRGDDEWPFCGHHADQHREHLTGQAYIEEPLGG